MDCKICKDQLADFLLDELPEREAVLVHEHLNICPECMEVYKQLKGTGKSLEAVPHLRSTLASTEFGEQVRAAARVESEKIIRTLPPERRVRMELRKATRANRVRRPSTTSERARSSPWSGAVIAAIVAGVVISGAILFFPGGGDPGTPVAMGEMTARVGKVQGFYKHAGQHWSEIKEGEALRDGDELACEETGRARFELDGGGLLLMGPGCEVKLRSDKAWGAHVVLELSDGELMLERPAQEPKDAAAAGLSWTVRSAGAEIAVHPGAHVWMGVQGGKNARSCEVRVSAGAVGVRTGAGSADVKEGMGMRLTREAANPVQPEAVLPEWRAELFSEAELQRILGGSVKVAGRGAEGLDLELQFGDGSASGLRNWKPEGEGAALSMRNDGRLPVAARVRYLLALPLAVPLAVQAVVDPETPADAAFAFAVADQGESQVSVDLESDAKLKISGPRPRADQVAYRSNATAPETVTLELKPKGTEVQVKLSTSSGATKVLTMAKEQAEAGVIWLMALREGLVLRRVVVSGRLGTKWLLQRYMAR